MPIWAKWAMVVACVALAISVVATGVTSRTQTDEFGSPAGMAYPEWFHFFLAVLIGSVVVIVLGIFLFFGRMTWVLNGAADIDLQRRLERERQWAAQFQRNVDGPMNQP
jgi:hypothetical protein